MVIGRVQVQNCQLISCATFWTVLFGRLLWSYSLFFCYQSQFIHIFLSLHRGQFLSFWLARFAVLFSLFSSRRQAWLCKTANYPLGNLWIEWPGVLGHLHFISATRAHASYGRSLQLSRYGYWPWEAAFSRIHIYCGSLCTVFTRRKECWSRIVHASYWMRDVLAQTSPPYPMEVFPIDRPVRFRRSSCTWADSLEFMMLTGQLANPSKMYSSSMIASIISAS